MGTLDSASPDLGVRGRKVHDRSYLVVLLVLGAGLSPTQARARSHEDWFADHGDLRDCRYRERRWWVAIVVVDHAWAQRKPGSQDGLVTMRSLRGSHHLRLSHRKHMGCGPFDRARGGRASGIFGELVYADF